MSIIYDALQKTQRNREYLKLQSSLTQKKSYRRHLKLLVLGVFTLAISAGAGGVASFYWNTWQAQLKLKPTIVEKAAPASRSLESQHLWLSMDSSKPAISQDLKPVVAQQAAQQPLALPQVPAFKNKLTLNGVLISGAEKIALINNQSFHLGDMIEGMKIVAIEFNSVKLQDGQQFVDLRV